MYEEIEILRSRTDEILVRVLSQWSQSVIAHQSSELPPFCGVACSLTEARDELAKAARSFQHLREREEYDRHNYPEGLGDDDGCVSYDIEEREIKATTTTKKGGRK